MIRWEYYSRPPRPGYEYPLAHVHVNGELVDRDAESRLDRSALRLHIPTARVGLELVLWHLVAEWGVNPKADDWQHLLRDSLEGFYERRTVS